MIRLVVIVLVLAGLILANVRLRSPGDLEMVEAQLRHLDGELADGAADEMQSVFPEGFVFTWTLYGLASAQMARQLDRGDPRREECLARARRAIDAVGSDHARSPFDAAMPPRYGAFYNAWSLYLLAEHARTVGPRDLPATVARELTTACDHFAVALDSSASPFLETYPGQVWPADTPPGVAALAIHDALLEPRYAETIKRWVRLARARCDSGFGALPHSVWPGTGASRGIVRGGSLALVCRLLVDIDQTFACEQYGLLREHFVDDLLGVPGVREYPHGEEGSGDVDSGPVIFGFTGPAIVVGAAAARANGDSELAEALLGSVELAGAPVQLGSERSYALGQYPVGDAFIAWARSTPAASSAFDWGPLETTLFVPFHLLSAALALFLVWWAVRVVRSRRAIHRALLAAHAE